MSLTSYRAAPPRVKGLTWFVFKHERGAWWRRDCVCGCFAKRLVLGRPGNDLLSRVLRHSTIGAEEFNGRVRDGIGFFSSSLKSPDRQRTNSRQGGQGPHPELCSSKVKNFILPPATLPDRKVRKPERASAPMRRVFLFNHHHGHGS